MVKEKNKVKKAYKYERKGQKLVRFFIPEYQFNDFKKAIEHVNSQYSDRPPLTMSKVLRKSVVDYTAANIEKKVTV